MLEITVRCDVPNGCPHDSHLTYKTNSGLLTLTADLSAIGAGVNPNLRNFMESCLKKFRQVHLDSTEKTVKWCCLYCLAEAMKKPYEEIKADHDKHWNHYSLKDFIALNLGNL